ncbi:DNA-directed RNA polymerase I subunit RPA12 isoform X1 [Hemitrygon akajei]|uniref:DNA-directed RNA polymerase I subunit RPA12 isoform X1 n=1 Tax=Hemitrygon akajei TaxID=2704970 RepID=UPI003BF95390
MADSCFESDPDFCPECGTILPLPGHEQFVVCRRCGFQISIHAFEGTEIHSELVFNDPEILLANLTTEDEAKDVNGPVVSVGGQLAEPHSPGAEAVLQSGGSEVLALWTRRDGISHTANTLGRRGADSVLHVYQLQAPREGGLLTMEKAATATRPRAGGGTPGQLVHLLEVQSLSLLSLFLCCGFCK